MFKLKMLKPNHPSLHGVHPRPWPTPVGPPRPAKISATALPGRYPSTPPPATTAEIHGWWWRNVAEPAEPNPRCQDTPVFGNPGARRPWQNQHCQQRAMNCSTLAVFCEHRYFENGHEMPWGRGPKHTFQWYLQGILRPIIFKTFFWEELLLSSTFKFRGQQLEQVLVDIVLSPYILICLAEQLWVGQAIDACLHKATNGAFAPRPHLINLLRSSNSTLSSLLLSSHFASELRAIVFDLFNSWGNMSTHVPGKVHSVSTGMSLHVHQP